MATSIGQKDAVVAQVKAYLGNTFTPYKDIALVMLSAQLLEALKKNIGDMILNGTVEYSKDITNVAEVRSYARSMVMNHLKKCRELNGGQVYTTNPAMVQSKKETKALCGVNLEILPEDLRTFVQGLV